MQSLAQKLTNMRASGKDDAIVLTTPVKFTPEQSHRVYR